MNEVVAVGAVGLVNEWLVKIYIDNENQPCVQEALDSEAVMHLKKWYCFC